MIRSYIPCMGQYPLTPLESKHESPFWMIMLVSREPSKTAKMFRCFKRRNQIDLNSKLQKKNNFSSDTGSLLKKHSCYFSWAFLHPGAYISTYSLIELLGSMTTMEDNLQLFHPPSKKKQARLKKKPPVFSILLMFLMFVGPRNCCFPNCET